MKYTYSKTGAKIKEENENLTVDFEFDDAGRLIEETDPQGTIKKYKYYDNDNREGLVVHNNSISTLMAFQAHSYDSMNRLTRVIGQVLKPNLIYTYDKNGNLETMGNGGITTTAYEYNDANLITSLTNKGYSTNKILSSFSYTYRLDGNQATKEDNLGKKTTYVYDDLGRLTSEVETYNGKTESKTYAFDKANNRETMTVSKTGESTYTTTYTYDKNNRLLKEEKAVSDAVNTKYITDYVYDNNGNQLSKTSYKLNNTTSNPSLTNISVSNKSLSSAQSGFENNIIEFNTFDVFNRLVKTESNTTGLTTYKYQPNGLRLSKTSNNQTIMHVWDGSNIISDLEYVNSALRIKAKYARGLGLVCELISMSYYLYNAHGDVVQLVDNTEAVIKTYDYDSFGVESNVDETDTNPFRYCGEYYDKETGNYYLRARYYNPRIGRFITEDPIRSGLNWYTYCYNNPLYYTDPWGLAEVGLREYAERNGATVDWNDKTKYASVTYNGKTYYVKSTSKNNRDGRIYIDDSVLNNKFGWPNPYMPSGETKAAHFGTHPVGKVMDLAEHGSVIIFAAYDSDLLKKYPNHFADKNKAFGMLYTTLGAAPNGDYLASNYNRESDRNLANKTQIVSLNAYDITSLSKLIDGEEYFRTQMANTVKYTFLPVLKDQYNSNSFAIGLIIASEINSPITRENEYGLRGAIPIRNPLPKSYFGH